MRNNGERTDEGVERCPRSQHLANGRLGLRNSRTDRVKICSDIDTDDLSVAALGVCVCTVPERCAVVANTFNLMLMNGGN